MGRGKSWSHVALVLGRGDKHSDSRKWRGQKPEKNCLVWLGLEYEKNCLVWLGLEYEKNCLVWLGLEYEKNCLVWLGLELFTEVRTKIREKVLTVEKMP